MLQTQSVSTISGFPTAKQEQTYNKFTAKLINILSNEILNRKKSLPDDTKFDDKILKLYTAFKLMEKQKGCDPKYSDSFKEVTSYILQQKTGRSDSKNASQLEH